jgi:branched-chain amino acid transport system permease protein
MIAGQLLNGIVVGSMYALIALGFTLIIGVLHRLNFAHPEVFMLGGFIGVAAGGAALPAWAALPLAFLIGGLLGVLVERISFRKFSGEDAGITASLSSLAVGLLIADAVHHRWGTDPVAVGLAPELSRGGVAIFGVTFVPLQGLVLGVALVLMLALHWLVNRSALGRNIRAVADSPDHAALLGVDVKRVTQAVFFVSSALAAVAGLLFAMRVGTASADIGLIFGLKALAVMAIGGMGDLRGAVVGGFLVGVLEALGIYFGLGRLAELIVWVFMILVLLLRPQGLFGSRFHGTETRA